ncbi:cation transporter [Tenacibaculum sp. ZS6-P6]|uniref:cation transporter n=1 Tax=Tenacibaculum sp. ZS6-P6 TaxID=3447503 RepID=UPI003F99F96B
MYKTVFKIAKMDCPSEENLIRLKLNHISGIVNLEFDLKDRKLTVFHNEKTDLIEKSIIELKLGGKKISTEQTNQITFKKKSSQRKLLFTILGINFIFFLIEMTSGIISKSIGLIADSLDMLADSFVYGISLLAIGKSILRKRFIAKVAGYFQIILAFIGLVEVLRRFSEATNYPNYTTMIIISCFSLIANGICLYLLQKSKSKEEIHIKASLIFTSNDVIINLGVISAGFLVYWLNSNKPDLIIGIIIFTLVIRGAIRILKL